MGGAVSDLYTHGTTHRSSNEMKLLTTLVRQTTLLGEKFVHSGGASTTWHKVGEPGAHVVKLLLEIRALAEKLVTLKELTFEDPDEVDSGSGNVDVDPFNYWHQ